MKMQSYSQDNYDHTLFVKKARREVVIFLIYIDDISY